MRPGRLGKALSGPQSWVGSMNEVVQRLRQRYPDALGMLSALRTLLLDQGEQWAPECWQP